MYVASANDVLANGLQSAIEERKYNCGVLLLPLKCLVLFNLLLIVLLLVMMKPYNDEWSSIDIVNEKR